MSKYFADKNELLGSPVNIVIIILALVSFLISIVLSGLIRINWGINQIYYLPQILFYIWIVLSAAALLLMFMAPSRHFIAEWLSVYFWGEKKLIGRLVFIIIALLLFVLLRFDAHLYGNSYIRISNFAQKTIPIFKWFEYGGTALPYSFFLIIHSVVPDIIDAAIRSYQIISFVSGAIFLFFAFKITDVLVRDNNDRTAAFLLILFSGTTMFFFGMVENTPILPALISIFIYYMVVLNQDRQKKYLVYIWITSIIGLLFDLQFIIVFPVVAYLSFKHLIKREKIGSFWGYLAAFVSMLIAVAVLYLKAVDNLALQNAILFFSGKSPELDYSLFSSKHMIDIFNLFYLLAPLFPIYIFSIIRGFTIFRADINFRTLGLLTIAQIIYMLIIDPKNGMAREISVFGPTLIVFSFLGVYALLQLKRYFALSQNIFMALSPIAFLLIVPTFIIHLSPEGTKKYLDDYLEYNETKYEAALYAFRDYYIIKDQDSLAILREKAITAKAPGALESKLINDLYSHDRVDEAFTYALRLVERFPYNAVYHMQKGNLLKYYKKPIDAEQEYKIALELDPYRLEIYHFLSELYRDMKMESKCLDVLTTAVAIDPKSTMILLDLAGYNYRARQFNVVDSLCDLVVGLDRDEPYSYMFKGLAAEANGRDEQAKTYYEKFISIGQNLPDATLIRKRLNNIVLRMRDSTATE